MCNKVKLTKRQASEFLNSVKRYRNDYRREKRSYYCEECNAWHTTSRDLEQETSIIEEISDPTYLEQWRKLLNQTT